MRRGRIVWAGVLTIGFAPTTATAPAPLVLLASNVSKAAIEPLVPVCAREAGIAVRADYANNPAVAKAVEDGASFDVVVVETNMLRGLAEKGFIAKDSIRPLAALAMGLATREGGPVPRIATVRDFKRALLAARSIGYVGDGHSGILFLQLLDRLELRDRLADKLMTFTGAYAGAAEASARMQYVAAPFFNPLPAPLRLVGQFPKELGADVDVSAGAASRAGPTAARFIACLKSPTARAVFKRAGYRLDR